jgi:predicted anti-sigma-YlaC factor YlaD
MNCNEIRERMPDVAAGLANFTAEESKHLANCEACAGTLQKFRQTMALLDEWQAPEPSPYFDMRLQARLREEMARPQANWLQWLRRPLLAASLTLLMGIAVGLFFARGSGIYGPSNDDRVAENELQQSQPGTAVSDLQALENNHDLYADFELLDDLEVQSDVTANP